jgi:hypothetical protein
MKNYLIVYLHPNIFKVDKNNLSIINEHLFHNNNPITKLCKISYKDILIAVNSTIFDFIIINCKKEIKITI